MCIPADLTISESFTRIAVTYYWLMLIQGLTSDMNHEISTSAILAPMCLIIVNSLHAWHFCENVLFGMVKFRNPFKWWLKSWPRPIGDDFFNSSSIANHQVSTDRVSNERICLNRNWKITNWPPGMIIVQVLKLQMTDLSKPPVTSTGRRPANQPVLMVV